jgi:hypothetical protein
VREVTLVLERFVTSGTNGANGLTGEKYAGKAAPGPPGSCLVSRGCGCKAVIVSMSDCATSTVTELDSLLATLHSLRASVLGKLGGLSEDDARRSTVPSGTNLAGLIQHLTFVESKWFEQIVAGRKPSRGKRSMHVDPAVSLSALRADYRAACDASDALIRELGDPAAPVTHNGRTHDLRWAIFAVINETARHAGHADIIREQIDGKTGR